MKRAIRTTAVALAALFPAGGAIAAPASEPPPVAVHTSVDRTALWVGDRVTYTVELRCAPHVDVLTDDLAKDRLRVEGGEILDAASEELPGDAAVVRRIRYTITSYRVDAPEVRIEPFTVRYYSRRRLDAVAEAAPAGELTVPGVRLAIRSTLPDGGRLPAWREPATLRSVPASIRYARPLGLALIALAALPLALLAADVAGHVRRLWARRHAHRTRRRQRLSFAQVRALDPASDAERIRAYAQLDTVVRDHLQLVTGVNTHALTPAELRAALERRKPGAPAEEVEALLALCERARYAPEPPPAEGWPDAVRRAEQVLDATRR